MRLLLVSNKNVFLIRIKRNEREKKWLDLEPNHALYDEMMNRDSYQQQVVAHFSLETVFERRNLWMLV